MLTIHKIYTAICAYIIVNLVVNIHYSWLYNVIMSYLHNYSANADEFIRKTNV